MPYIGNTSPSRFVSNRAASVYSGDGSTTAFTLEQVVTQDEDVLVSVDGVIQEPSVAYAVSSGTTLTFTAAPSSNAGNNIFVYYLASQVGTVGHPAAQNLSAGTGTFTGAITGGGVLTTGGNIVIPNAGNIGSASDTDAMAISSGGVVTFSQTPSLSVPFIMLDKDGNQTITSGSRTVVTGWTVTSGNSQGLSLASNSVTVDATTAGKYFCNWQCSVNSNGNNIGDFRLSILQEGTRKIGAYNLLLAGSTGSDPFDAAWYTANVSGILVLTTNDTVTVDVHATAGGTVVVSGGDGESPLSTNFSMFRIGG